MEKSMFEILEYREIPYSIFRGPPSRYHYHGWFIASVHYADLVRDRVPMPKMITTPKFDREIDADDFIRCIIDMALDILER